MNVNKYAAEIFSSASAASNTKSYYGLDGRKNQFGFDRAKLPSPIAVLNMLRISAGRANRGGYFKLRCPFHKNGVERSPSLNVHQVEGHFLCHACNAKGGDILAFYMKVTGSSFTRAAKELGAWRYENV